MNSAVLDRSVFSHLYSDLSANRSWRLPRIKVACDQFNELYYEPEGTSALQNELAGCEWLQGKIWRLPFSSTVRLSARQQADLSESLHHIARQEMVRAAVHDYNSASGGQVREVEEVLGYLFRITLLARSVQAALLCWRPRAKFMRAVFNAMSVSVQDLAARNDFSSFLSEPTIFPFGTGEHAVPFQYAVFDYGDSTTTRSIFLSYSSSDKDFVRKLTGDLTAAGARVWLDETEIDPGASFVAKIEDGLIHSEIFLLVLSPQSVGSNWVQTELRIAVHREISGKNPSVIPVLWRDCEMPAILSDRSYLDFRTPADYEVALERLLRRVGLRSNK